MFYNMLEYEAYGYAIVKVYLLPGIKKGGLPSVCGMPSFYGFCLADLNLPQAYSKGISGC